MFSGRQQKIILPLRMQFNYKIVGIGKEGLRIYIKL